MKKEINLDALLEDDKYLILGSKRIKVSNLPVLRALKATSLQQKANDMLNEMVNKISKDISYEAKVEIAMSSIKNANKYISLLIEACLYIIKPIGFFARFKYFFSKNRVTKKWLMNNVTRKQITQFINEIMGDVA